MRFFKANNILSALHQSRYYVYALLLITLCVGWYSTGYSSAGSKHHLKFDFESNPPSALFDKSNPEDYLRSIQNFLDQGDYDNALRVSEELVNAFPTFQVGQWLYADILSLSSDQDNVDVMSSIESSEKATLLAGLRKELTRRLEALRNPYRPGTIPEGLGHLDATTEYFMVADASTSRIYLFRNTSSADQVQIELIFQTYMSVGLNGINKKYEGDKRSPLGVYFTQQLLPGRKLPDLYGSGALTLNYPNLYDVSNGRTGSGIWLHGTPSSQYSRAPEASDGCLVLSNDMMARLMMLDNPKGIPVFIQDQVAWVPAGAARKVPEEIKRFISDRYNAAVNPTRAQSSEASVSRYFSWRDQDQTVALLDLSIPDKKSLRTYWIADSQGWKLIAESPVD